MCGILGGIATGTIAAAGDGQRLKRAIDLLTHRGPDDWGQYVSTDGCAFLGHRRLSIIDLAGGHQPITDESRRIHFCYNGEIYNYRSLRAELI
ncbi:MAG: asparagine synthetase B, partial [Planctomycetota bacterium]